MKPRILDNIAVKAIIQLVTNIIMIDPIKSVKLVTNDDML